MQLFKNLFHKPLSTQLTVTSSNGFHLRPVAKFVHTAKTFNCDIYATFNGKSVEAKKVNTLLSLSLETNDTFTLTTQGKDAQNTLNTLKTLFNTLMQDDVAVISIDKSTSTYTSNVIQGDIISQGIVIAPTFGYKTEQTQQDTNLSFSEAVQQTVTQLEEKYTHEKNSPSASIYLAQKELLLSLESHSHDLDSFEKHIHQEIATLKGTTLSAKISDYLDLLHQVKKALGWQVKLLLPTSDAILIADDLLPSEISLIEQSHIRGVILKETSINAHSAILLRAAGIPSLIADTSTLVPKQHIILDAYAGVVVPSANKEEIQKATAQQTQKNKEKENVYTKRFESAQTTQGKIIKVYANVGDEQSAKIAKEEGAEGIGLLRSEFLFTSTKPSLEVQTKAYAEIFSNFDDVTVRTLDVGGDKALPYIHLPKENNPFLGIRGVRLFKTHPEILKEQLHAIFLAAKDKKIKVMFPMVSSIEEFKEAKNMAISVAKKHNLNIRHIDFGIMIEVPSVLFLISEFNKVVDFYSIGTNDLTQYLFAIERTHTTLSTDALSPVVFTAVEKIIKESTKPVSICGELAANTDAIEKLIALGLSTISVSPKSVAQTKESVRLV